jgi:ribonuclease VapC
VIVLDSSALIAILRLEADAKELLRVLVNARGRLMSALNVVETSLVLAGANGSAEVWHPFDAFLAEAGVEVVPFDRDQAMHARNAFLRFGKGHHQAALNFGDCAAYALAKSRDLPLLFKGSDFSRTDLTRAA